MDGRGAHEVPPLADELLTSTDKKHIKHVFGRGRVSSLQQCILGEIAHALVDGPTLMHIAALNEFSHGRMGGVGKGTRS